MVSKLDDTQVGILLRMMWNVILVMDMRTVSRHKWPCMAQRRPPHSVAVAS